MSKDYIVILARADWCGHCRNFEPIYDNAKNNYKKNKYLKDLKINFKDYNLADDKIKTIFMMNHLKASDKISGYPTVLINIREKNNKNDYFTVDHTVIDSNLDKDKQIDEASTKFLENISNALKSLSNGNSSLFINVGGEHNKNFTSLEDSKYRDKYLKYKSKYLKIK